MTSPFWTVNQFDAAACITLTEINRKMQQVFEQTDRLPKSWSYNGHSTIDAELGCPHVDWDTSITNGVKLKTPIVSGSYTHYTIDFTSGSTNSVPETIPLTGMTIDIETDMGKTSIPGSYMLTLEALDNLHNNQGLSDDHYKRLQTIVNLYYQNENTFWAACKNAFVSYYKYEITKAADLGRDAQTNQTLGYELTQAKIDNLNSAGTLPTDQYNALKTLIGNKYVDEKTFWDACVKAFTDNSIDTDEHHSEIIAAANLQTVDTAFTVESLYANMESPHAIHDMGTGYMLDNVALGAPGTLNLSEPILSALRTGVDGDRHQILGHTYGDEASFWTACTQAMTTAGIGQNEQNNAKQAIVNVAQVYKISSEDLGLHGKLAQAGVNGNLREALLELLGQSYSNEASFWAAAEKAHEGSIGEDEQTKIKSVVTKYILSAAATGMPSRLTTHKNDAHDPYEPVSNAILDALKQLRNQPYADESSFWQACEEAIKEYAHIEPQDIKPAYKQTILADGQAIVSTIDGDNKVALSANLKAIYTDPSYKNNYVFGLAKIPHVQSTVGPFAPRNLRFSRWPLSYADGADTTKGSLNWNLMTSGDPNTIPDLPPVTGNAGVFDSDPIPDGAVGAIYLSFEKIIMDVILPQAFKSMGLDGSKWSADADHCYAATNTDVALNIQNLDRITGGTFTHDKTKIYPDVANHRIKVDFQIEDVTFDKEAGDIVKNILGGLVGLVLAGVAGNPKYRITWSGYFTFSLDAQQELSLSYTNDTPNVEVMDYQLAWRIVDDIISLGINEARWHDNLRDIESDAQNYVKTQSPKTLSEIKAAIQLPGGAVFDFDSVDVTNLGVRAHLKYQDQYDLAGSSQA
ncbi:hypothetical protein [Microseira wollei]|uniref:Uncharacterized protein n=1 Tax=Microseira wollei NIES-4236 TaxID=2530354 RepID=A0AAV3XLC0_9CYAN|nr:hypothetical protein [Microseira wollei]GET41444.1 hypothetical protein MiSe_62560 [Microseira wollei NIES-4236]